MIRNLILGILALVTLASCTDTPSDEAKVEQLMMEEQTPEWNARLEYAACLARIYAYDISVRAAENNDTASFKREVVEQVCLPYEQAYSVELQKIANCGTHPTCPQNTANEVIKIAKREAHKAAKRAVREYNAK